MSREITYHKKIKKDYQRKNLHNPFFHKPKKKGNPRLTGYLIVFGFIILLVIIWFFLGSNTWRIANVRVEGLTRVSDTEITDLIWQQTHERRFLAFRQSNLWLFKKDEARDGILSLYNFSSLEIAKKPGKTLIIKVGERPYAFIFQEGINFNYASREADIIKETMVTEEDKLKYFILENKNPESLITENNKIKIAENYLSFIFTLSELLAATPEVAVERYIIDHEFNTIKVKFKDGPEVYFNTKTEAKPQVERLLLVKREKIKDNFNKTNYIDLRYGDRIFIN